MSAEEVLWAIETVFHLHFLAFSSGEDLCGLLACRPRVSECVVFLEPFLHFGVACEERVYISPPLLLQRRRGSFPGFLPFSSAIQPLRSESSAVAAAAAAAVSAPVLRYSAT